jgi:hypothetical protein
MSDEDSGLGIGAEYEEALRLHGRQESNHDRHPYRATP